MTFSFHRAHVAFIAASLVAGDCQAGLFSWFKKDGEKSGLEKISDQELTSKALEHLSLQQDAALQAVKKDGTISDIASDERWFGDLTVRVTGNYTATYGFPFGFKEKGLHIEKDRSSRSLFVLLDAPRPLSVAVDTQSIHVSARTRTGPRTWNKVPELQNNATKWMSQMAEQAALEQSSDAELREAARMVVRDMVLDLVGEMITQEQKRALASQIYVSYTDEKSMEGVEEIKPGTQVNLLKGARADASRLAGKGTKKK